MAMNVRPPITDVVLGGVVDALAGQAVAKQSSVKYATLVSNIANKYARQLGPHKQSLAMIADVVTSFMKRPLTAAVEKL